MLEIRQGEARDLAGVAAVQAASPEAAQWNPADYLDYEFRVATSETGVAGFLVARRVAEGEAEILNLAVAPQFRRQGVARALAESFLEGFPGAVYLEVRASNTSAQEFYKTFGFQQVSVREGYYHTPAEAAIVLKFHSCYRGDRRSYRL